MSSCKLFFINLGIAAMLANPVSAAENTIYSFSPWVSLAPGSNPLGSLLRDSNGALYGSTLDGGAYYNGTVFKLSPPVPGRANWNLQVIYTFRGYADGGSPNAHLVMDSTGAIYGTASIGGHWTSQGIAFKLTPPMSGSGEWTKTTLHTFYYFGYGTNTDDGSNPSGGLIMDRAGNLYGTTDLGGTMPNGSGTVFKLTPLDAARTRWQESVIYRFKGGADGANPMDALSMDNAGAIYGTTLYGGIGPCYKGCGTIFKLTPPPTGQGAWNKTNLYSFTGGPDGGTPQGKLLIGLSGSLYGAGYKGGTGKCEDGLGYVIGCGVIYKLIPPAAGQSRWTYTLLHDFQGPDGQFPQGGVIADTNGTLVGTASAGGPFSYGVGSFGLVFRLVPPAAGQRGWTEYVLHNFDVSHSGTTPVGELVRSPDGHIFGAAHGGGTGLGGTIFEITPGNQ